MVAPSTVTFRVCFYFEPRAWFLRLSGLILGVNLLPERRNVTPIQFEHWIFDWNNSILHTSALLQFSFKNSLNFARDP